MLRLNIIPAELKQEIKHIKILQLFKRLGFLLVSFILVYAAVFVASSQVLKRYAKDVFANQASIGKNSTEYIDKVKNINEQINSVAKIQENYIPFSDFLLDIFKKINQGVKLNQLTIDQETGNFTLSGTADSRDSLLKLKTDLESSGLFSELDLPINNLLKKDDINFTISAKLKNYGKK